MMPDNENRTLAQKTQADVGRGLARLPQSICPPLRTPFMRGALQAKALRANRIHQIKLNSPIVMGKHFNCEIQSKLYTMQWA